MNSDDFNKCRAFLEEQIAGSQDKKDLLLVYQRLIELKSEHDKATTKAVIEKEIREAELNEKFNSSVHANNTSHNMALNKNVTDYQINRDNQMFATYQGMVPYVMPNLYPPR